jgi:hypothetical protein
MDHRRRALLLGMMTRAKTISGVVVGLLVIVAVVLRLSLPIGIDGDWTGSLTECACHHWNLVRFHNGHITWYGHGGEASELKDWGTYRKIGRNTYEWSSPKHPAVTVRVGWFLSSYQGGFLPPNEVLYCWRYPFPRRAEKLYQECEQFTATKAKQ